MSRITIYIHHLVSSIPLRLLRELAKDVRVQLQPSLLLSGSIIALKPKPMIPMITSEIAKQAAPTYQRKILDSLYLLCYKIAFSSLKRAISSQS